MMLETVVREIEAHAAQQGWDQPSQIFALVPTADLVAADPSLKEILGQGVLTPVEQEPLGDEPLESVLARIVWPEAVAGCAVVAERLVLTSDAEGDIPEDPQAAADFVAAHPERHEVRIVAATLRDGIETTSEHRTWCALRMREHDDDGSVLVGPELVPGLVDLLKGTLEDDAHE